MTEENKKRQENETIKDWLKRTSIKDDSWLKKAKHRQQTSWNRWYCLHKNHVNKMYSNAKIGYEPTEAIDIENPSLWKPEHWKWYLDNYR